MFKKILFVLITCFTFQGFLVLATDTSTAVMCTMDAKVCSDGSYVGREWPNCEFASCPEDSNNCTSDVVNVCGQPPMSECPDGMACAQVMPEPQTYSDLCKLKSEWAEYLYLGECKEDWENDCIGEGEAGTNGSLWPNDPNLWLKCCEWLTLVNPPKAYDDGGEMWEGFGTICAKVGDGYCDSNYENEYNSKDCVEDSLCTMEYAPVCGVIYPDGDELGHWGAWFRYKTFSNECELKNNKEGYQYKYAGECTMEYDPIIPDNCISWYDGCNTCSVDSWKLGWCTKRYCVQHNTPTCMKYEEEPVVECTMEYDPVCGQPYMSECYDWIDCNQGMLDPQTYSNMCIMETEWASYIHDGNCWETVIIDQAPEIKDKYREIVDNFLKKMFAMIDEKYASIDEKIKFLGIVSERIIKLSEEKPKFEQILLYIDWYIQEAIAFYTDDMGELSDLLDSLY